MKNDKACPALSAPAPCLPPKLLEMKWRSSHARALEDLRPDAGVRTVIKSDGQIGLRSCKAARSGLLKYDS